MPSSLPPFPLFGIFEREYLQTELGVGVDGNNPVFICASEDAVNAVHGDSIIIDDADLDGTPGTTEFKVVSIQPDGTGLTTLELEEQ